MCVQWCVLVIVCLSGLVCSKIDEISDKSLPLILCNVPCMFSFYVCLFYSFQPDAKKLLGVMQTLRVTEKKYTNKAAAT